VKDAAGECPLMSASRTFDAPGGKVRESPEVDIESSISLSLFTNLSRLRRSAYLLLMREFHVTKDQSYRQTRWRFSSAKNSSPVTDE
jgi:hypothetical protein